MLVFRKRKTETEQCEGTRFKKRKKKERMIKTKDVKTF